METLSMNFSAILPEVFLAVSAMALLILGVCKGNGFALSQMVLAKIAILAAMFLLVATPAPTTVSFNGLFLTNEFTTLCKMLVLIGSLFALYLSIGYYRDNKEHAVCEYPVLIILSIVGMMLMISANSLLALYMGLELQSLALYVLAAIHRDNLKSSEAGLKYFVLGALSSGIILYGCSLVYGFSGTTDFAAMKALYAAGGTLPIGVMIGLVFIITGICFKVSAVPFHMWTPDVYEGSPTPVTTFFAVAPKIAALAIFIRFVMEPFGTSVNQWQQIIIFVSAASMIVGALGAIMQTNIKRLIAYSSIGHVGYILVGLAAASAEGVKAILLYLVIYMTLSLGMFACIMLIKRKEGKSEDLMSFSGLSKTKPFIAIIISIIMLSMAGIPPFAGFFGKFFVFYAAVKQGLYGLAVIGVLSSVLAAFYYLKIIKIMYFDEITVPLDKNIAHELKIVAGAAALFNLLFFIAFTPFVDAAEKAASFVF